MTAYLLPLLKLLGLLFTAFFGIAEHLNKRKRSLNSESTRKKWGIIAILVSFLVAAGAELIDDIGKIHEAAVSEKRYTEANEKTQRIIADLDRSLHPLLPIRVSITIKLNTQSHLFDALRTKIINETRKTDWKRLILNGDLFPNRNSDPQSYALLTAQPRPTIFLTKSPRHNVFPANQDVDLTFVLKNSIESPQLDQELKERYYTYDKSGDIFVEFPVEDFSKAVYSSGEIISTSDLPGSQISIWIYPYASPEISKYISVSSLDIIFPGNQEIILDSLKLDSKKNHAYIRQQGWFSYRFPNTKKGLQKLYQP